MNVWLCSCFRFPFVFNNLIVSTMKGPRRTSRLQPLLPLRKPMTEARAKRLVKVLEKIRRTSTLPQQPQWTPSNQTTQ